MANDSDNKLLARANSYDRQALAAIYDEYQAPIYRYVSRQVEDMETARDLSAEVFKRLLQAIKNGQGPDQKLRPWLYRTAHNIVVDHYRRRQFRAHLPLSDQLADQLADDGIGPEVEVDNRINGLRIHEALGILTDDQRQVITLKFLAGLSNEEVAQIMDKPVGAVKGLQHRGLASLQRQLIPTKEKALC